MFLFIKAFFIFFKNHYGIYIVHPDVKGYVVIIWIHFLFCFVSYNMKSIVL